MKLKHVLMAVHVLLAAQSFSYNTLASDEATQRYNDLCSTLSSLKPQQVNGYQTDRPPQAELMDQAKKLDQAAGQVVDSDPGAQLLMDSAHQRPYFAIDATQDAMVVHANEAVTQPEVTIAATTETVVESPQYDIKRCVESKPAGRHRCRKTLLPPVIHIEPAKYSHYWCREGNHQPDDPNCSAKIRYDQARLYQAEQVTVVREEWVNSCLSIEKLLRAGVCKLVRQTCPKGAETRQVNAGTNARGKPQIRNIHRPCWQYELEYECFYPSANNCTPLRQQGCEQIDSQVIKSVGDQAVVWQQTFRCSRGKPKVTRKPAVGQTAFKLPDQALPDYAPNHDMHQAISNLEVLKEVGADLKANSVEQDKAQAILGVFKGQSLGCDKHVVGFSDCCVRLSGWGVGLGLSKCNAGEKQLAQLKERGLCHEVGEYCAERVLGVCIRRRKNYCCFPSKLSRIVHEQGRPQLGISWGNAKEPQCQGFLVDELARLDFSQLNLSELYADINNRVKEKVDTTQTKHILERNITDRVKHMTAKGQIDDLR